MRHWSSLSFFLAVAIAVLVCDRELIDQLPESEVRSAVGIAAQISATMLGFLIAALSILASISGHRLLRNMQRTGHYKVLLRRLFWNAGAYGLTMVVAATSIVLKGSFFPAGALATLTAFIFATLLLLDIAWRFWLVLSNLSPD